MNTARYRALAVLGVFSLGLLTLGMSGCASMSRSECAAVDWRTIGYEDGAAGFPGEHIAQHRKACAKYGITPNFDLYQAGRSQGLREYCRPSNGYRLGAVGGSYAGVCPSGLEAPFLEGYDAGRQLYTLQSGVADAANRLDAARRELDQVEHEIVSSSAVVISADASTETRAHSLLEANQLAERAGRLKAQIEDLQRDKARAQRQLESYLASVPRGR